jgi:hypothetical protein
MFPLNVTHRIKFRQVLNHLKDLKKILRSKSEKCSERLHFSIESTMSFQLINTDQVNALSKEV